MIGLDVSTLIAAAVSLKSASEGIVLIGGTGKCPDCKAGKPIYCDAPKMKGITADGAWAEYMVASVHSLHPSVMVTDCIQ